MQEDDFEVQFCDLCGTSVPLSDLESGAAVRHQAKTIGGCCLTVLRQGDSPLVSPGLPAAHDRPARKSGDVGLLPMAIALAVAIAGATIYLELDIQRVAERQVTFQSETGEALKSGSDVLQAIDQAMDGVARKADLDGLYERVAGMDKVLEKVGLLEQRQQAMSGQLERGLEGMRAEVAAAGKDGIDYRPLFDDLRQQIMQQARALDDLRSGGVVAAAAAAEHAPDPLPPSVAPGLPAELQVQIDRLRDPDAAVRFEAVDHLLVSKNPAVLPELVVMTRDEDGFVRRLTVEGLRDFREAAAVEALIEALGDSDSTVADTAWGSLKRLTGQKLAFDASAPSKEARARQQQRWRDWWADNKDAFGG